MTEPFERSSAALARMQRQFDRLFGDALDGRLVREAGPAMLAEVRDFGDNPGRLRMFAVVPADLPPRAPLVVVLHGCTQTAAGYDLGAGWSLLADRYGFALLYPEQRRLNNPKRCFNWFRPQDAVREGGEAASIRQMVARLLADHPLDPGRVFVTGLSAGGAMTSVMLATYPEVFAGGAIIAGVPYGAAGGVREALDTMFEGRPRPAREWGERVRAASAHKGPWPKVSVWHGSADTVVVPMNADEIVKQWIDVQGLPETPSRDERVAGHRRQVWTRWDGDMLESITVDGMAHGTPLDGAGGDHGTPGGFFLEAGISSSYHIARFFGLTSGAAAARARDKRAAMRPRRAASPPQGGDSDVRPPSAGAPAPPNPPLRWRILAQALRLLHPRR